ncbi:MAG: hypothetical protein HRU41_20925 [Saprospiraceae bacterium]|nr:hypothetical protein [Saprospiraceae bacterium]
MLGRRPTSARDHGKGRRDDGDNTNIGEGDQGEARSGRTPLQPVDAAPSAVAGVFHLRHNREEW